MNINPRELTETEHGRRIIFDTPYGRGMGYWMSGDLDLSKPYAVEHTINEHFIPGRNLFTAEESVYRISIRDQSNHIQGRIINYQDIHLLEIGAAKIMLDLDHDYADQWATIIVPAASLKIYDCNY
ncbi:MAG TPA: hypothetical protein VD886_19955 [Herpetosiphonaceae bacterium]|nr:hypothetical protein [Herpetosiphonaceae bacterium]